MGASQATGLGSAEAPEPHSGLGPTGAIPSAVQRDLNWGRNAIAFIRARGLAVEFNDWCGGWKCPVDAIGYKALDAVSTDPRFCSNAERKLMIGALQRMRLSLKADFADFCALDIAIATLSMPTADEDEAYEIGKRDGYSEAVQAIDLLTGGDGEYRACLGIQDERHCPDPETMKQRIADRFAAIAMARGSAETACPAPVPQDCQARPEGIAQ